MTPTDTSRGCAHVCGLVGGNALAGYELLEDRPMLAMRRGDTKGRAKALLWKFGSLGRVLTAEPTALIPVDGVGEIAAALKIAQATAVALLREQAAAQPMLASWQALLDYLRADRASLAVERVRVLHLDSKNMLIRDEVMSEGTSDQAADFIRQFTKRARAPGSANLIVVHNQSRGDTTPSRADFQLTRDILTAGRPLGVAVHDHVIVGASGHTSLRAQGLM